MKNVLLLLILPLFLSCVTVPVKSSLCETTIKELASMHVQSEQRMGHKFEEQVLTCQETAGNGVYVITKVLDPLLGEFHFILEFEVNEGVAEMLQVKMFYDEPVLVETPPSPKDGYDL